MVKEIALFKNVVGWKKIKIKSGDKRNKRPLFFTSKYSTNK